MKCDEPKSEAVTCLEARARELTLSRTKRRTGKLRLSHFFLLSLSLPGSTGIVRVIFRLNIPVNRRGDWRPVAIKGNAVASESCEVKSN